MEQRAYYVNKRIFFSADKLGDYILQLVHEWKINGCSGTFHFPKVRVGTYTLITFAEGQQFAVFKEKSTGYTFTKPIG